MGLSLRDNVSMAITTAARDELAIFVPVRSDEQV
jgi:hypothetical protein